MFAKFLEHILLKAVNNFLKGLARSIFLSLGNKASLGDIMEKWNGFFGNVASGETLMQTFYNDNKKDGESKVMYASRLEAISLDHIETVVIGGMLRRMYQKMKFEKKNSRKPLYQ